MIKKIVNGKPVGNEQSIVNQIIDYLELQGFHPIHIRNTGSIIHKKGKTFFAKPRKSQRGLSDIVFSYYSLFVAIEVKKPGERQSPDQEEWEKKIISGRSDGEYWLCESVDDVAINLARIGVYVKRLLEIMLTTKTHK